VKYDHPNGEAYPEDEDPGQDLPSTSFGSVGPDGVPAFFWAAMFVFIKVVHAAWDHSADDAGTAAEGHDPSPTLELLVDGCHHFIRAFGALDGDW